MLKLSAPIIVLILFGAAFQTTIAKESIYRTDVNGSRSFQIKPSESDDPRKAAIARTQQIVVEIVEASFPELRTASIRIKTFKSRSDYFRSQFSISRFLTFRKLHFIIYVNPSVFERNAPADGIRAIIAHELAHADYYRRHNRLKLLGLVGLYSKSFTARFERGADLQAIKRGHGLGLKEYREWLYANIPAEKIAAKKRNYFSPAEIDLLLDGLRQNPEQIDFWLTNVPRNASEIRSNTLFTRALDRSPCGVLPAC